MEDAHILATLPDPDSVSPQVRGHSSGALDLLSPLSVGASVPHVPLPPIVVRRASADDARAAADGAALTPPTTVTVPLMMRTAGTDSGTTTSPTQQSASLSIFTSTPPFYRTASSPSRLVCAGVGEAEQEMRTYGHFGATQPSLSPHLPLQLQPRIITPSASLSIPGYGNSTATSSADPSGSAARARRKLRESEVSFTSASTGGAGTTVAAPTAATAPQSLGANALSGGLNLRGPGARFGKSSSVAALASSSAAGSSLLPGGDGLGRSNPSNWNATAYSSRAANSTNDDSRGESSRYDTVGGSRAGAGNSYASTARSAAVTAASWAPTTVGVTPRPLMRLPSSLRVSAPTSAANRHWYAGDAAASEEAMSSMRHNGAPSAKRRRRSCRVPVSVAVMMSTIITVILVATMTIVPLNTVSIQAADSVTSTLSLSLASSYTRSVEATMLFLPNAISTYAFAYMNCADQLTWNWTAADMPQAMRQMCHTVAGTQRNPTSFLLYMSLSSPYSGYSAYCSQQYNASFLVGNYITDNSSQPRYFIDSYSYNYAIPLTEYPAVMSMTPWDYTVDFGGSENAWHKVVVPWYSEYLASTQPRTTAANSTGLTVDFGPDLTDIVAPKPSILSPASYLNGYWRVVTVGNVSVITYSFPFVDSAGHPATISGALQTDGFNSLHPGGLIASSPTARAMVVDTTSGLVFLASCPQDTAVRLDNWNESCNCTPGGQQQSGIYIDDIDDPLMISAVQNIGGIKGIMNTPIEVERWIGEFSGDGTENLMVVSRVDITSNFSDMTLVVVFAVRRSEFTDSINQVQRSTLISVLTVLVVVVMVEIAMLYLMVQPVRGIAAGLRAAAELRDGRECVDDVTSVVKEVAEMQRDFRIMNAKLMQMKTFLPQGMLGAEASYSDTQNATDTNPPLSPTSATYGRGATGLSGSNGVFGEESLPNAPQRSCRDGDDDEGGGGGAFGSNESGALIGQRRMLQEQSDETPLADAMSLRLNDRVLLDEVNHFRRRYCSIIAFCMHVMESEIGVKFLNEHCAYFMEGVLPCVLRHGGVVELQRPDYIVVSFGAHNKVAMHQGRAAKCALEVMHLLNTTTPIGPRVGCLLDASEYYVGTCGAAGRNAVVTFSHSLAAKGDLIRILKSVQTQILLTQRLASTLENTMLLMPVDCIVLNPIGKKDVILYELRGHIRMLPPEVSEVMVRQVIRAVRMGFTRMLKGDYVKALEMLEPYESTELQAARLAFMCRAFVARHISHPFVRSVTRLTFSEAHFSGYNEDHLGEWMDAHVSGASMGTHSPGNGQGVSAEVANPLGVNPAAFAFSPFMNELDPTALLTTPATMRLVVGAEPSPPTPSHEDGVGRANEGSTTAGAASAMTRVNNASTSTHRSSVFGYEASASAREAPVSTASAASAAATDGAAGAAPAGADEGETALFEMFIEDQQDDDDDDDDDGAEGGTAVAGAAAGGDGASTSAVHGAPSASMQEAGESQGGSVAPSSAPPARRLRKGELPLFFHDYEGNPWRRSYDVLGTGAFSTVYRGLSMSGNLVALKCFQLSARNSDVHAIVDEIRLFANLHHENVVQYLSLYVSESFVIEIMEFVPGGSLDTLLKSFGCLRPESMRRYLRDITRGLGYLHAACIVHCDIKSHNVLLAMDGQCKLSDFGSAIARATSSVCKIDDVLEMRGTPGYMAPEVARDDVPTMKSDVYSLGVTVLELLTGKLPWDYADTFALEASTTRLVRGRSATERRGPQQLADLASPLGLSAPGASETGLTVAQVPPRRPSSSNTATFGSSHTDPAPSTNTTACGLEASGRTTEPSHNQSNSTRSGNEAVTSTSAGSKLLFVSEGDVNGPLGNAFTTAGASAGVAAPPALTRFRRSSVELARLPASIAGEPGATAPSSTQGQWFADARPGTKEGGTGGGDEAAGARTGVPRRSSVAASNHSRCASDTAGSSFVQTHRSTPSVHRRPIEQVLRSATQLVVYIGRGWVVPHIPDTLDEDVVDFLELCLNPDPEQRATMSELMLHPWLM